MDVLFFPSVSEQVLYWACWLALREAGCNTVVLSGLSMI